MNITREWLERFEERFSGLYTTRKVDEMKINGNYAEIAYNAYREASGGTTFDGRPMPTWDELGALPHGARTRRLWSAAALEILTVALPAAREELQACQEVHDYLDRAGVPRGGADGEGAERFTILERVEMFGALSARPAR